MSIIKLTERERHLIRKGQLHAREPLASLATRLGMRPHAARYSLQRLIQHGVVRPVPLIDNYRLGYKTFQVLFSLSAHHSRSKELFGALERSPRTAWLAEMGGDFQYGVRLCARDERELLECLDTLESQFGDAISRRVTATIINFWIFPKKYLWPDDDVKEELTIGQVDTFPPIDETDRGILSKLGEYRLPSHHEIGRQLFLSRSTVDYRIRRMENDGVITGYLFLVSALSLGMLPYRILIGASSNRSLLKAKLLRYAREHPHVVNFSECLGSWDFEATVEVERPHEITPVVQEISQSFHPNVGTIQVIPLFRQLQSSHFLRFARARGGEKNAVHA
jgi:DNA-binding Lrp family transcriptional regulator